MRLTSMTIKNFKGIGEHGVRIDFSPITLLFGPNNAGKSTVIQALHLAQEVLCHPQADYDNVDTRGKGLDLGTFKDYVHEHDLNRDVCISLEMAVSGLPVSHDDLERQSWERWNDVDALLNQIEHIGVDFVLRWSWQSNKPELAEYAVSINKRPLTTLRIITSGSEVLADIDFFDVSGFLPPEEHTKLLAQAEGAWDRITKKPEDYGNELLDLKDAAIEALHPFMRPFANMQRLVTHITGSDELGSLAAGELRTIGCNVGSAALAQWGDWLPLDYDDIEPIHSAEIYDNGALFNTMTLFQSLLLGPARCVQRALSELLYIGPLRSIPARGAFRTQKPSVTRWAEGLAAWDVLATLPARQLAAINQQLHGENSLQTGYTLQRKRLLILDAEAPLMPALRKLVMDDLDEGALPLLRDFLAQAPEIRLTLRNETSGVELEPHDMGVGISQVLPVVVAATTARRGALVAIEQPELHIHPAWQTALGDVFIKAIAGQETPPLFLLETHSEHLMLRLLRRIRETHEGELPESFPQVLPEMLSVLYVQPNEEGNTEIMQIPVTPDGDFGKKWPNGFFAERAKELF